MALSHSPRIVIDGLVLCLDAGNTKSYSGSGTTWTDLSGNGNNGTLTNGPTFSSANGGSLSFDGADDYVDIPSTPDLNFSSLDFTIESWSFFDISTSSDNIYRNIFWIGDESNYIQLAKWRSELGNGVNLDYAVSGGRYCITTTNVIPSPNISATVTSPLYDVPGKWSHFVASIRSNVMYLYINSILYGSVALGPRWNQNQVMYIGRRGSSFVYPMDGRISLIKIYKNKGLTASEIQQNFNALRGRYGI